VVDNERLTLNVKEAAQALGLSRNSVYQGCIKGEIPHVKVGKRILIPKAQLERLLLGTSEAKSE
jgi:excisionase family DNA binding protein